MIKHTNYRVSSDGRVFSSSGWRGYGEREMQQTPNADGYPSVRLVIDGRRKRVAVHRLVADAYLGAKPVGYEVCHINGDKTDNRAENLRYGTRKENAADREQHGRTSCGERHSAAIKASNHKERVKRGADHYLTKARAANV